MRKGIAGLVLVCALSAPLEEFWHSISMIQALLCSPSAFFENALLLTSQCTDTLGRESSSLANRVPYWLEKIFANWIPLRVDVSRTAGLT